MTTIHSARATGWRIVELALLLECPDPHLNRLSLIEEVENGTPTGHRARRTAGR